MKKSKVFISLIIIVNSLISALFANALECTTDKYSKVIHLIGENHIDPEFIKLKKSLREQAKNGDIILVLEGSDINDKINDQTFGIDNAYIALWGKCLEFHTAIAYYAISKNIIDSTKLEHPPSDITQLKASFKRAMGSFFHTLEYQLARMMVAPCELWLRKKDWDEPGRQRLADNQVIFKKILELCKLKGNEPKKFAIKNTEIIKHHSSEKPFFLNLHKDVNQWINFYKDLFYLYAQEIKQDGNPFLLSKIDEVSKCIEKFQQNLNKDIESITIEERFDLFNSITADASMSNLLVNDIALNVRNQVFLNNLLVLLENNKSQDKPFYVNTGVMHSIFLYAELKKLGYTVEMNDFAQKYYDESLFKTQ